MRNELTKVTRDQAYREFIVYQARELESCLPVLAMWADEDARAFVTTYPLRPITPKPDYEQGDAHIRHREWTW